MVLWISAGCSWRLQYCRRIGLADIGSANYMMSSIGLQRTMLKTSV
jgi:hypothetical protein